MKSSSWCNGSLPVWRRWLWFFTGISLGLPVLFLLWHAGTYSGSLRLVQPLPDRSQIIDIHCHIACLDETQGCYVSPALKQNIRFPAYLHLMHASEEVLKHQGAGVIADAISRELQQSQHVSSAVLLALDGVVRDGRVSQSASQIIVPNDFVAAEAARHRNLWFGASVNPYRSDALNELQRVYDKGAVLIKWIPSIMEIDPADPALIPFYRKMAELGLPLLTHTGNEHAFSHADDALADPERLHLPLRMGVTVIAAHVASIGSYRDQEYFDRLLPMFARYPRLYADISSLTQINKTRYMEQVLRHPEIDDHLLYGSDWPLPFFPLVSPWYFQRFLTLGELVALSHIDNTWDADVRLKQALGVPATIFGRTAELLPQRSMPGSR